MSADTNVAIFDFDGTLADVAEIIRALYGDLALQRGWPELTDAEYKKLRKGTVQQALKWVGIRPWQMPSLLREGRAQFKSRSDDILLFNDVSEVVTQLHEAGWHIYILSSNSPDTIRKVLKINGLDDKVTVLRRPSMFGKAKSINKLVESRDYAKDRVWMIGDELRDVDGGNKAGVKSLAVSWGLQDISVLRAAHPTAVADKPVDIVTILNQG